MADARPMSRAPALRCPTIAPRSSRRCGCRDSSGDRAAVAVVQADPVLVLPARHRLEPARVVEVPLHRIAHAAFEGVARAPAELAADLGGVHRVTAIVSGTILDELHER